MENEKKYQILDGTMLKIIAMVSMVFDHVGDLFLPGVMWLRMIGRLAMPLFSFCIAEGYAHTRDKSRYLLRMGIFALISEVPFDLACEGKVGFGHVGHIDVNACVLVAGSGAGSIEGKGSDRIGHASHVGTVDDGLDIAVVVGGIADGTV